MTSRRVVPGLLLAVALLRPAPALAAFATLSGKVTDANGAGLFGVQINFIDACTGVTAAAANNVTSSLGTFSATVNAGIYDVEFVPPAGSLYTAYRLRDFDLTTNRTLAPIVLPFGITVSGTVTDANGVRLPNVFVHFHPPGSAERVFTVRDRTDASGNYSVVVAPGVYDVKFGPPGGTRFLGLVRPSLPIAGNTTLPVTVLASGVLLGGAITDPQNQPVINVNLDVVNPATGEVPFLPHDRTDATGAYSLAVPAGNWIVRYKPGACTHLLAEETAPIEVPADLALGSRSLARGLLIKGTVTDVRGGAVNDVNTNWLVQDQLTGLFSQVLTFNDHTGAAGGYDVVVPAGNYNIEFAPPDGLRLAGVKLTGQSLRQDMTLNPVSLPDGFAVSGRTTTVEGAPVPIVDLDFFESGGGVKIYTPHDTTDAAGMFSVVVPPGRYDIRWEPPSATRFAARRRNGTDVGSDMPLGDVVMIRGLVVTGRVTDDLGASVEAADLDFYDAYTGAKAETLHDNTDAAGAYSVIVPPATYNVRFVPPAGAPYETGRVGGLAITADLSGLDAVLRTGGSVSGRVRDAAGLPVELVEVDFFLAGTRVLQYTSRHTTAADGTFSVFVPSGTYDLEFMPASASGLAPFFLAGIPAALLSDTDIGDVTLSPALTPAIASIAPGSGPAAGGTPVTILGASFQPGVRCLIGGLDLLDPVLVSGGRIDGITAGAPVPFSGAPADVTVVNRGAPAATLAGAFTFEAPAAPIALTVTRASPSIVLSWPATGQSSYRVYRSTSPGVFGQAEILTTTGGTGFTDVGADADGINYFYRVE